MRTDTSIITQLAATNGHHPVPFVEDEEDCGAVATNDGVVWKPFPTEALPKALREFVVAVGTSMRCDTTYVALPVLAVMAACIGASRTVLAKESWSEPSVLWVATVGPSGTCKSPPFAAATEPLMQLQGEWIRQYAKKREQYETELQRYEAELSHWKRTGVKKGEEQPVKPAEPICRRVAAGDATCESLHPILNENPRGVGIFCDELARFFNFGEYKQGKGSSDVANFLSSWRASCWTIDRKSARQPIHIPRAAISVAGTVQPAVLLEVLNRLRLEDGTAGRFLYGYPPPQPREWTDAVIPGPVWLSYKQCAINLLNIEFGRDERDNPIPVGLPLSRQAKEKFVAFFNSHAKEAVEGPLASAFAKMDSQCLRLALVIQLATDPDADEVDAESMGAAIVLTRWFANEARRVFSMFAGETNDNLADRELADWISLHGGRTTPRKVKAGFRRFKKRTTDDIEKSLTRLVPKYGKWSVIKAERGPASLEFVLHQTSSIVEPVSEDSKDWLDIE